jgi:hypothetical protein
MLADTLSWFPIETVNWGALSPTYPFRFNGPGYLYCMWCTHFIRLVCRTKTGVSCSGCGQALALAPQSFIPEDPSTTQPGPLSTNLLEFSQE